MIETSIKSNNIERLLLILFKNDTIFEGLEQ